MMKPSWPLSYDVARYDTLKPWVANFEQRVWFGLGVCNQVRQARNRRFAGENERFYVRAFATAGRVMFTFEVKETGDWISVVVAEDADNPTMGLQARSMDDSEFIRMMKDVTESWPGIVES